MEDQYWILSDSNSVYLNIPFVRYQAQILRHINTTITVFWVFFFSPFIEQARSVTCKKMKRDPWRQKIIS